MKKKYIIPFVILFVVGLGIFGFVARPHTVKRGNTVGAYQVLEENKEGRCQYKASYRGKTIELGEYVSENGCHTTQSNVSNGMLAIAGGEQTFFYDPVRNKSLTLDPNTIQSFKDFAKSHDLNLSDYPSRRYFLNKTSWNIWYQKQPDTTGVAPGKPIVFTTKDAGNTFTFDPGEQQ